MSNVHDPWSRAVDSDFARRSAAYLVRHGLSGTQAEKALITELGLEPKRAERIVSQLAS